MARRYMKYSANFSKRIIAALFACLVSSCDQQAPAASQSVANPTSELASKVMDSLRLQAKEEGAGYSSGTDAEAEKALLLHMQQPFESWQFLAFLRNSDGDRYVVRQQFIRLTPPKTLAVSVSPTSTEKQSSAQSSAWQFEHVLLLDYAFYALDAGENTSQQDAQRVALGLAGAERDESADMSRVWLTSYQLKSRLDSRCDSPITVSSPEFELQFGMSCDQFESLPSMSASASRGVPVTGRVINENDQTTVTGYGWFERAWGVPPASGSSAVVLDRAWLWLNDSLLSVQRTRRRQGEGPQISRALLTDIASDQPQQWQAIELLWKSEPSDITISVDAMLSQALTLNDSARPSLESVLLNPVPIAQQGGRGAERLSSIRSEFVPVIASGDASGFGFIEIAQ